MEIFHADQWFDRVECKTLGSEDEEIDDWQN
jgi:hypothetical protein